MDAFFSSLSGLELVFMSCAVAGGLAFLAWLVLQFAGGFGEVHADATHAEVSGDSDTSFKLLSFQGLTGFLMMFGLVGMALATGGSGVGLSVGGAVVAGCVTILVIAKIFEGMRRLQSSGTIDMRNAIGAEGKIYLRIPPGGTGKVEVAIQGRLMILDAVSGETAEIATGTPVVVERLVSDTVLSVKRAQEEA
jgi:hypothetical protein